MVVFEKEIRRKLLKIYVTMMMITTTTTMITAVTIMMG